MAFPVSPTNGQTSSVNNILYTYASATRSWTRVLAGANVITANSLILSTGLQNTAIGNVTPSTALFTTVGASGNITAAALTINASITASTTIRASGGLQATPIGNATASSAAFTTIGATGTFTGTTINAATIGNASAVHTGASYTATTSFNGPLSGTLGSAGGNTAIVSTLSSTGNTTVSALTVNTSATVGTTLGVTGNITGGNVNTAGVVRATGDVFGKELWSINSVGDEGGQLNLGIPVTSTSLTGQVTIDVYQNKLRFFQGTSAKGAYIDLTAAADNVGTNLLAGGGGGSPGGANTYVQFNDASTFGGNANFTYDKGFNTLYAGTFAGTLNGSGQNFKVGDDAWIGDINLSNALGIKGQQDATQAYIVFGNSNTQTLGRIGTGALTYQGGFTAQGGLQNTPIGNATASSASFTTVGASGTFTGTTINAATIGNTGALITGTLQTAAQTNITSVGNIAAAGMTSSARVAPNANASIDLGATGLRWNNVYGVTFSGVSTTAKYADLAEIYSADENYSPGTVVVFGGPHEITVTSIAHDTRVAGVISTNPAYLMNSETAGLPVALTGRVPCLVQGPVNKGDVLVTSVTAGAAQKINPARFQPGCVIGKALENILDAELKIIEVVVGRF